MVQKHIYTVKKNYSIYILLDKDSKTFYIWYAINESLANTYRRHYTETIKKTKTWFEELKKTNKKPCIFILETQEMSRPECYILTLIWNKIFLENGYKSIETKEILEEANDIYDENLDLYRNRKTLNINEIIDCKQCILPKYKNILCHKYKENDIEKLKRKPEKKKRIEIKLDADEYETVMEKATNCSMEINKYVKSIALDGEIILYNYDELKNLNLQISKLQKKLNQYIITLLSTTQYYPEDIENLQKSFDELLKEQKEIMLHLRKKRRKVRNKKLK